MSGNPLEKGTENFLESPANVAKNYHENCNKGERYKSKQVTDMNQGVDLSFV